jgi:ParB/RepB/Spo0J family partition protein
MKKKLNKRLPALRVKHSDVFPNGWNPNHVPPDKYEKLKQWLADLHADGKALPPIVVRPHKNPGQYEIIDGEHRWKAFGELGFKFINVFVMDVDTPTAMMLTTDMDYLKGERDESSYIKMLHLLHTKHEIPVTTLTERLPETRDELVDKLALYDTDEAVDLLAQMQKEQRERSKKITDDADADPEAWVELKFVVPLSASKIIEAEISRIEAHLSGSRRRARSLEYMAVQSSQGEVTVPENMRRKRKAKKTDGRSAPEGS